MLQLTITMLNDNMYGDITELMPLSAAASVIALYDILGNPDGRIPDPISWENFETLHGHLRRVVGWEFNTRNLTFALRVYCCVASTGHRSYHSSEQGVQVVGLAIKPLHKLLIKSDNSPSCHWAHKLSAKAEWGQLFDSIYANLIDRTQLTVD